MTRFKLKTTTMKLIPETIDSIKYHKMETNVNDIKHILKPSLNIDITNSSHITGKKKKRNNIFEVEEMSMDVNFNSKFP